MGMIRDPYKVSNSAQRYLENHGGLHKNINVDPLKDVYTRVEHKYHYRNEEQGIFHPLLHQGLKLRNNGAADLFVDQDNGFRIDPTTQTINAFANHYKAHLHNMTSWLTGSANFYVNENWQVKTKGKHIINASGDVEIRTKKNLIVTVDSNENVTIKGNANVKVEGNVSAEIGGNLNAKVKGHATMDVSRELTLKAKHLNVDVGSYDVPWMPHEHPQYALKDHGHTQYASKGHTHPEYEDDE